MKQFILEYVIPATISFGIGFVTGVLVIAYTYNLKI